LLDLQAIDVTLAQLEHRRRTLPEIAELTELAKRQQSIRNELVTAQTQVSDIAREQDKLEADIDQVRQRMSRDQQRLDTGAVSSAKELESLQHEIDSLAKRQRDLEDVELEVMERREETEGKASGLAAEQEQLANSIADAERRRVDALAAIDKDAEYAHRQRATVEPEISADLLALYDKLRGQLDGLAAVAIKRRRCDGCQLELTATDIGRVRAAAEDDILRCEECRRIQVRTEESGL
jgi:predicted  nucleic acid-binding Zn-ribbon protein